MQKIDEKDRAGLITFLRNRRDNLAQMLPLKTLRRYEDLINQIALEALESDLEKSSTVVASGCKHEHLKITEEVRPPLYLKVRRVECEVCGWFEKSDEYSGF